VKKILIDKEEIPVKCKRCQKDFERGFFAEFSKGSQEELFKTGTYEIMEPFTLCFDCYTILEKWLENKLQSPITIEEMQKIMTQAIINQQILNGSWELFK
jgi:hypothetical protein